MSSYVSGLRVVYEVLISPPSFLKLSLFNIYDPKAYIFLTKVQSYIFINVILKKYVLYLYDICT